MVEILGALALVAVAAAIWLATLWLGERRRARGWSGAVERRVLVTMKSGTAVEGLLEDASAQLLRIRDARVIEAGASGDPIPADGVVLLERAGVDFVQVSTWP